MIAVRIPQSKLELEVLRRPQRFGGDLQGASTGLRDVPCSVISVIRDNLRRLAGCEVLGWLQILLFIGLVEGSGFFSGKYGLGFMKDATMDGTPGDYGVGFPTFIGKVSDPASKTTKLSAELANGRLAMMAIIGMFFQDGNSSGISAHSACWMFWSRSVTVMKL